MAKSIALRDASVVIPGKVLTEATVMVERGRIAAVDRASAQADEDISLSGLTLFPGFIDLHMHGAVGVDTMRATAAEFVRVSQFLSSQGVTAWMPTLVPAAAEEYASAIESMGAVMQSSDGAEILGVHYEGPFVNTGQCGALHTNFFRTFTSEKDLEDLPQLATGKHLMTVAPEVEGGIELIRYLVGRGWIISLGHTRADVSMLDQAFNAGAMHMTHFMNAMAPLHHRSPGPVAWGLLRDDVTCDLIADGIHLDRTTLKLLLKMKRPERLVLISDAIAAAGLGDGDYEVWGETITVRDGKTTNAGGSIAGSVITVLDAVKLMKSLGVSETEIAEMSALNPARVLGVDAERGSIEVEKRADLVAIDDDGHVRMTMVGGEIVYSKSSGDSL